MEEIPEDVRALAVGYWTEATEKAGIGGIISSIDLIARAILAERERAAKLVEEGIWINPYVRQHEPAYVAKAIRSGAHP